MLRPSLAVALSLAGLACGGSSRPVASAEPPASSSPQSAGTDAQRTPPAALTRGDCEAMVNHIIDLNLESRRARGPEHLPSPEAVEQLRNGLSAELVPACVETPNRALVDCVMAAPDEAAVRACDVAGGP